MTTEISLKKKTSYTNAETAANNTDNLKFIRATTWKAKALKLNDPHISVIFTVSVSPFPNGGYHILESSSLNSQKCDRQSLQC